MASRTLHGVFRGTARGEVALHPNAEPLSNCITANVAGSVPLSRVSLLLRGDAGQGISARLAMSR